LNIVVTGAAGFIGSSLADKLLRQGHTVLGVDCFTNYYSKLLKEENIINLKKSKNFSFIESDLMALDLIKLLKNVDVVFHEAAQPGVRKSWGIDFNDYVHNNISVMQALLEAAKESSLKHLVYASSSSIYGDSEKYPTSEDALPKPVSPYGVTKLACEHLCNAYQKNFNLPIVMLRYFTVYGPKQRPDMAFNKFIRAALSGKTITIYGNGLQTRDFTFVQDVVDANILILKKDIQNGIFNIGGGSRIAINEVIKIIGKLIDEELKIHYANPEKGDVTHTCADITKAKQELGFEPKTSIKDGLSSEIEWFKTNMQRLGSDSD